MTMMKTQFWPGCIGYCVALKNNRNLAIMSTKIITDKPKASCPILAPFKHTQFKDSLYLAASTFSPTTPSSQPRPLINMSLVQFTFVY